MPNRTTPLSSRRPIALILVLFLIYTIPCQSSALGEGQNDSLETHWQAPAAAALRPNPNYADEESLDQGKLLFREYCVFCHGRDGEGDGPYRERLEAIPANLSKLPAALSDGDLAWKIAHGRYPMPAWQGIIEEEDIWDIVNFIRSLQKTETEEAAQNF